MALKNILSSIATAAVVGGGVALAAGSVVGSQETRSTQKNAQLCSEINSLVENQPMDVFAVALFAAQSERLGCDQALLTRIILDKK